MIPEEKYKPNKSEDMEKSLEDNDVPSVLSGSDNEENENDTSITDVEYKKIIAKILKGESQFDDHKNMIVSFIPKANKEENPDNEEEIWASLTAYEFSQYIISNLGRFYNIKTKNLIPVKDRHNRSNGLKYYTVSINNNGGVRKEISVPRFVAYCFLPYQENSDKLLIRRKNNINSDSRASNLYWSTRSEINSSRSKLIKVMKKVGQYKNTGELIKIWNSAVDAGKELGTNPSNIRRAAKREKICANFLWKYIDDEILEGEEWKELNLEGFYPIHVSSMGRVKVQNGVVTIGTLTGEYRRTDIKSITGDFVSKFVHELVALAFIGPKPLGCGINHINLNKQDNRACNLEYMTPKENVHHALENGHIKSNRVQLIDEEGKIVQEFLSVKKASEALGIAQSTVNRWANNGKLVNGCSIKVFNS